MNYSETKNKFKGTGVAIVTPFNKNNEIDYVSLQKLVEHVIDGGVNYIVLFGTTGEAPTIIIQEKQEAVKKVAGFINKRVPLVLGFGGNFTENLIKDIKSFDFSGVDAILSVCPYYNKPNQDGIYSHFAAIANATTIPIILYNVPGRTIVNIEPNTTIKLANTFKNIIGIKEATDNLDHVMGLINNKPEDFIVVAGDDALALPFMSLGADGAISVIANAMPSYFSSIINEVAKGDYDKARDNHYKLLPLMHALLKTGNPSGIKAVLNEMKLCENIFRLPVHPANKEQIELLVNEARKLI